MDDPTQTYVAAPNYPENCPRCKSGFRSYSGDRLRVDVRYACGSTWIAHCVDGMWSTIIDHSCKPGDDAICSNCGSVKCMHMVCRDWETIDRCDGWCCPECRPVDYDQALPKNWREMPATPRHTVDGGAVSE